MSTYEMIAIIADSAVRNVGNMSLIALQLVISLFFEVKFLFDSMKNRPILVKMCISLIPLILIGTYGIVGGIIFSSFLGNGPTPQGMTKLVQITLSKGYISEVLIVVAVFMVLMIVYSVVYKMKLLPWMMTFGIEMLASLSLITLYGGLFVRHFPFTILDLCGQDIYLARWPIYQYFTLLFKCAVLIIALFLGLMLRERKVKAENEEEKYMDRCGYYDKKVLKFLTQNDMLTGISLLFFGIAALVFCMWQTLRDKTIIWDLEMGFTMAVVTALFLAPVVLGVTLIHRALWPRTMKAYQQMLAAGDKDMVLRLFCEEIVDNNQIEVKLRRNDINIRTKHFIFRRQGIRVWVEWIGERL